MSCGEGLTNLLGQFTSVIRLPFKYGPLRPIVVEEIALQPWWRSEGTLSAL